MLISFLFMLTNTNAHVCIPNKKERERELSYTIGNMLTLCYVSPKGK